MRRRLVVQGVMGILFGRRVWGWGRWGLRRGDAADWDLGA